MKRILRLDRLGLRGLNGVRDEVPLTATAQNLRRLAKLLCRARHLWRRPAEHHKQHGSRRHHPSQRDCESLKLKPSQDRPEFCNTIPPIADIPTPSFQVRRWVKKWVFLFEKLGIFACQSGAPVQEQICLRFRRPSSLSSS
jgi:hypothetical protein